MPPELIGQIAGLATSACFSAGSVFFTLASRQVGALILNRTRLLFALLLLGLAHWLVFGTPYPTTAGSTQWVWLGLSGMVGLALGDLFLFQGYTLIGPRLTMVMMSLSPILSAILAWIFLHEGLTAWQIIGITVAISGVTWVVADKNSHSTQLDSKGKPKQGLEPNYLIGILFGLGAATCQSLGLVLARQGLGNDFPALSGNFIRMLCAAVSIWLITLLQGQGKHTFMVLRSHPNALKFAAAGAFVAPFLGVSLSLLAIQKAPIGIASTLMALPPVLLLPVDALVFKKRAGWQSIAGTFLALAGIALLFIA